MKKYILGSKSTYRYILGVKSMYQYILVYVGLYRYHTIAWYIPVHTGTYWYELGTYHWSGFQMLKRHDLLSDRIYQGYTRYIPCIYQTYTKRRSLASLLSPIRAWKPQTGISFGSSQSWPLRGRPREAGAVQSSTARC